MAADAKCYPGLTQGGRGYGRTCYQGKTKLIYYPSNTTKGKTKLIYYPSNTTKGIAIKGTNLRVEVVKY